MAAIKSLSKLQVFFFLVCNIKRHLISTFHDVTWVGQQHNLAILDFPYSVKIVYKHVNKQTTISSYSSRLCISIYTSLKIIVCVTISGLK